MNEQAVCNKISVVIVNWNGEQFLERCLSALMCQTVKPHEIILVDNASSDGSLMIVRQFPLVFIIAHDQNSGFARGNNLAIKAASKDSEWIALLNPDAYPEPNWLETLLIAAYENPEFDLFGSKLVNATNPVLLDGAGDAYHVSGLVWPMGRDAPVLSCPTKEYEIFSPCAAAALYRRSALQRVGGFDEDFFCYMEDVDLGFRLRLAGYCCLLVPSSVVHHVGSGTTGSRHSDFARYHGHRNVVWTYVKNMPGFLFWVYLPLHIMMNIVAPMVLVFRGQGRLILRAKWDAIQGIPNMWRKRRQVQATREVTLYKIWHLMDKSIFPTRR